MRAKLKHGSSTFSFAVMSGVNFFLVYASIVHCDNVLGRYNPQEDKKIGDEMEDMAVPRSVRS